MPIAPSKTEDYLTPAEVVARFKGRITIKSLANWRSIGSGPPFTKVGGKALYPVSGLTDWEKSRTFTVTPTRRGK